LKTYTWKKAAQRLSELQLTSLTRQSPVEVLYDFLVRCENGTDSTMPPHTSTFTSGFTPEGSAIFMYLGNEDNDKYVEVDSAWPDWPSSRTKGVGVRLAL